MPAQTTRLINQYETIAPARLTRFLAQLEHAQTSEEVWTLLVALGCAVDLPLVDYVCATDYRDWEKAQFIRTTVDASWIDHARQNPNIRKMSYFRTHAVAALTPIYVGIEYAQMYDPSPERYEIMELSASMGLRSGIGIPLRMPEPGQAAILIFGGGMKRAAFERLMHSEGWTLNAAALAAHMRYMELFNAEFFERNKLSDKQRELVTLIGQGMLDKQIGHELGISVSAVRQRMASVLARTGAANRAEIAALAMRVGLVPDPTLKSHKDNLTVFLSTGTGETGLETRRPYAPKMTK